MRKAEFLKELEEALTGEVSAAVMRENLNYYSQYISSECLKGRSEEEVIREIGSPRLIARTIIDSSAAGGGRTGTGGGFSEAPGSFESRYAGKDPNEQRNPYFHYVDLNKWYWKLLGVILFFIVIAAIFAIVGGVFSLLVHLAPVLIVIWLIYAVIRSMRR